MSDPLGLGVSGQWGAHHHPASQINRQTPPPSGFRFEIGSAPIDWVKIGESLGERRSQRERGNNL